MARASGPTLAAPTAALPASAPIAPLTTALRDAPLLEEGAADALAFGDALLFGALAVRLDAGRDAALALRAVPAEEPEARRADPDDARFGFDVWPGVDPAAVLPWTFDPADLLLAALADREERLLLVLCVATDASSGCLR